MDTPPPGEEALGPGPRGLGVCVPACEPAPAQRSALRAAFGVHVPDGNPLVGPMD